MIYLIYFIVFLSGASTLIFEYLWFHLLGIAVVNSVWSCSIVLSSFMCGLAIGNALTIVEGGRLKSPLRFYALLEIIVGLSGFFIIIYFSHLPDFIGMIFQQSSSNNAYLNLVRFAFSFCLLLFPTIAMGTSLPVMVKALYNKMFNFRRVSGFLYEWYSLGAVVGVLITEFFFVSYFGIKGTSIIAVACSFFASFIALLLSLKKNSTHAINLSKKRPPLFENLSNATLRLLLVSFLTGFAVLALNVLWFRFILQFFNNVILNFTVMLAVVILGISIGVFIGSKLFQAKSDSQKYMPVTALTNGILLMLSYRYFDFFHTLFVGSGEFNEIFRIIFISIILILPVMLGSGILFAMTGKATHSEIESDTKMVSLDTLSNTTGGCFGAIIAGVVFIPFLGIENSIFICMLIYFLIGILLISKRHLVVRKVPIYAFVLIFIFVTAGTMAFPFHMMKKKLIPLSSVEFTKMGEKKIAVKEGLTETIQYLEKNLLQKPYYHRLINNSYQISSTRLICKKYMKFSVYLPMAIHKKAENALLICFGCGSTAKALTDTKSLTNIDIVDISQDIIEMSDIVFNGPETNPVNDPRVTLHIENGRFYLLSTNNKYDLITTEPPPVLNNKGMNLYTQEYFQCLYDCLSVNGIVSYGLPVHQLTVRQTKAILKGFGNVFKEYSLWIGAGTHWMMVGIKNPGKKVSYDEFARQWNDPIVGPEIKALGFESPEQFGSYFIADNIRIKKWVNDVEPLTDNYPKILSTYHYPYDNIKNDFPIYNDFMDAEKSATNFINSRQIKKLWPAKLKENAQAFFKTRNIINNLFTKQSKAFDATKLHTFLNEHYSPNCILWLLGSDEYAQRIINETDSFDPATSGNNKEIFYHFTAGALSEKNFKRAEYFLEQGMRGIKGFNRANSKLFFLRMYILNVLEEKVKFQSVEEQFINLEETNKQLRRLMIKRYNCWLATL